MDYSEHIEGTHFTWGEALKNGATYATPTDEQRANIIKQAHLLERVRDLLGPMRVTSWLRTPEHHQEIYKAINDARAKNGLAPVSVPKNSAHLTGAATDFVCTRVGTELAKKLIQDSNVYPGGGELNSDGWIHLDTLHTHWFKA